MRSWLRKSLLFVSSLIIFPLGVSAQSNQTESLTISTYYPSPYGVYRDMEIHRSVKFTGINKDTLTAPARGMLVFNDSDSQFYFYNGTVDQWKPLAGNLSGELPLKMSLHTQSECTNHPQHGQLTPTDTAFKQCQFNLGGCPAGWQPSGWTTSISTPCQVNSGWPSPLCYGVPYSCNTPHPHGWSTAAPETCQYCVATGGSFVIQTCYAASAQVGCL